MGPMALSGKELQARYPYAPDVERARDPDQRTALEELDQCSSDSRKATFACYWGAAVDIFTTMFHEQMDVLDELADLAGTDAEQPIDIELMATLGGVSLAGAAGAIGKAVSERTGRLLEQHGQGRAPVGRQAAR